MTVPGAFFEVTGAADEIIRIEAGIEENEGRLTSDQSFSLDLWLDMLDEWQGLNNMVRAGGEAICPACDLPYWKHLRVSNQVPTLARACDGRLLKL